MDGGRCGFTNSSSVVLNNHRQKNHGKEWKKRKAELIEERAQEDLRSETVEKRFNSLAGLRSALAATAVDIADQYDLEYRRDEYMADVEDHNEANRANLMDVEMPPPLRVFRREEVVDAFDADASPSQSSEVDPTPLEMLENGFSNASEESGDDEISEGGEGIEPEDENREREFDDSDNDEEDMSEPGIEGEGGFLGLDANFSDADNNSEADSAEQDSRIESNGDNEFEVHEPFTKRHPQAGATLPVAPGSSQPARVPPERIPLNERGPWYPFKNSDDFKTGAFFIRHNHTKGSVQEGFNRGVYNQTNLSFASADALRKRVDGMEPDFAASQWIKGVGRFFADAKNELQDYWYRDIAKVIQHYFRQPAYREHLIYAPAKEYNSSGKRVFSDMYTGKWWWRTQVSKLHVLSHPVAGVLTVN